MQLLTIWLPLFAACWSGGDCSCALCWQLCSLEWRVHEGETHRVLDTHEQQLQQQLGEQACMLLNLFAPSVKLQPHSIAVLA
jgi:hypothetical protein